MDVYIESLEGKRSEALLVRIWKNKIWVSTPKSYIYLKSYRRT